MIINMDKAKFYMGISQFFGSSVESWKCVVPNGQLIPNTQGKRGDGFLFQGN